MYRLNTRSADSFCPCEYIMQNIWIPFRFNKRFQLRQLDLKLADDRQKCVRTQFKFYNYLNTSYYLNSFMHTRTLDLVTPVIGLH